MSFPIICPTEATGDRRLGSALASFDIKHIAASDAPKVAVSRMGGGDYAIRLSEGRYWRPSSRKNVSNETVEAMNSWAVREAFGWRYDGHVLAPTSHRLRRVYQSPGITRKASDDDVARSEVFRVVSARADSLAVIDGELYEEDYGPTLISNYLRERRFAGARWNLAVWRCAEPLETVLTFPVAMRAEMEEGARRVQGEDLVLDPQYEPRFLVDPASLPAPRTDFTALAIEAASHFLLYACERKMSHPTMRRGPVGKLLALREHLEERHANVGLLTTGTPKERWGRETDVMEVPPADALERLFLDAVTDPETPIQPWIRDVGAYVKARAEVGREFRPADVESADVEAMAMLCGVQR